MKVARVIPCLDVTEGRVVKGTNFVDLRDAGDLDHIGLAQEDVEPLADHERVFQVVDLFAEVGGLSPVAAAATIFVPDLPFIPREVNIMGAASFGLGIA